MKFYALLVICVAAAPAAAGPFVKIAGGHEATQGQFPWLVSVELTNTQDRWHLCDGVLVGSQWVLTTAHCLDHEDPSWLAVVSGEHQKDVLEGTEQIHKVDYFVKHPSYIYYQQPFVNDVGLVHLSYPVTFDAFTNLAPISGSLSPIGSCIEAGWGETSVSGGMSNILQYTSVPVLPLSDCEAAYSSPHDPKAVCAGNLNGGVGFCVGDTGGGLFCFNPLANRYEVSAILSWREGCAQPGKPGVYMNVASYWGWISSVIT